MVYIYVYSDIPGCFRLEAPDGDPGQPDHRGDAGAHQAEPVQGRRRRRLLRARALRVALIVGRVARYASLWVKAIHDTDTVLMLFFTRLAKFQKCLQKQ